MLYMGGLSIITNCFICYFVCLATSVYMYMYVHVSTCVCMWLHVSLYVLYVLYTSSVSAILLLYMCFVGVVHV